MIVVGWVYVASCVAGLICLLIAIAHAFVAYRRRRRFDRGFAAAQQVFADHVARHPAGEPDSLPELVEGLRTRARLPVGLSLLRDVP